MLVASPKYIFCIVLLILKGIIVTDDSDQSLVYTRDIYAVKLKYQNTYSYFQDNIHIFFCLCKYDVTIFRNLLINYLIVTEYQLLFLILHKR